MMPIIHVPDSGDLCLVCLSFLMFVHDGHCHDEETNIGLRKERGGGRWRERRGDEGEMEREERRGEEGGGVRREERGGEGEGE